MAKHLVVIQRDTPGIRIAGKHCPVFSVKFESEIT